MQKIAYGFGYKKVMKVKSQPEIENCLSSKPEGSIFVEIVCKRGNREDLGRPTETPEKNLAAFIKFLNRVKNEV